jgi:hypothetical protein
MLRVGRAFTAMTRVQFPLGRQDSVIQCMFWCMLASDITAICCDILQNLYGSHVFYYVCPMRIRALTCGLLPHSKIWTQNPPTLAVMGVRPPLPAPDLTLFKINQL